MGPLRVPIFAALVLVYLPLAALVPALPGAALIRGLFDLRALTPDGDVVWVLRTATTFFFAWLALAVAIVAVFQSAAMIHDLAPVRLGTPAVPTWLGLRDYRARIAVVVPVVPAMAASFLASLDGRHPPCKAVLVAGALAALAVVVLLRVAVRTCSSLKPHRLAVARSLAGRLARRIDMRGYDTGTTGIDPLAHHVRASLLLLMSAMVWLGVLGWALSPSVQPYVRVPAVCSLYLLLMLGTWGLSALTFFFDYYRIPILTLVLLPTLFVGVRGYLFDVQPASRPARPLLPAELIEARIGSPTGRVVAIAAAGGGIQAAAWTARVLEGLSEEAGPRRDAFLRRIVVVSGVSGGSVGLAPFVLALHAGKHELLDGRLTRTASVSSLDRLAATWATLDLLPLRLFTDRGLALQNTWIASWASMGLPGTVTLSMLTDRERGENGSLRAPGIMFNATSMTTGERMIFGTTVPTRPTTDEASFLQSAVVESGRRDTRRPEFRPVTVVPDIDVATAARLSATFPLVSPASRCSDCQGLPQYVVDGGYVDNSGVESLTEWLEALLADASMRRISVSLVQIVPFSQDECEKKDARRSSPSQAAVPLRTLYSVRGAGQARNSINNLVDLQREFTTPAWPGRVCIHSFVYHRCHDEHGFNPPLSWHLTDGQSEDVRITWDNKDRTEARRVVAESLGAGEADCFVETVQPSRTAPRASEKARRYRTLGPKIVY